MPLDGPHIHDGVRGDAVILEEAQAFMGVLFSSGLLSLVKVLELLCGLALISGFFVPMALVVLAPIIVNIVFFHVVLDPSKLMVGMVLTALWVINALGHRTALDPLLRAKPNVD
jgi:putative oxidoreductase